MKRRIGLLLCLPCVGALLACASIPAPGSLFARRVEGTVRTTLDNGLKVVLVEDHSAPVVALNVWVRTGSADERPEEGGMAHVFEHMLFKGTERRAVGEIASTVEAAGGNINAFTSYDMTVYHITMASRDADVGIDVLADAVQHSTFDADELDREREVVIEEIRRGLDSPHRVLSQALFELAYQSHPYRLPIIGTQELVRGFSRDQLLAFFGRWYVPDNMAFIAVGDLDPGATLELIRKAFAGAEPRGELDRSRTPEAPQQEPRVVVLRRSFQQTRFSLGYPITDFKDPDTAYLDLLSMVLGSGESSRLYRNVKDRLDFVHTVDSSAYTPLDPGLFVVSATVESDHLEAAMSAVGAELDRIRAFGPSEVELERVRVNLLASQIYEKETMQGQTRKLGYYETLAGGIEAEAEYLERIRRATPADLQRVALEYLLPERVNIAVLLPEKERRDLVDRDLLGALTASVDKGSQLHGEPIREDIFRYRLPNGLTVIVKPRRSVPVLAIRLAFRGGLLGETERTQGLTSFLAEMLERGTEQRSASQIAAEVEGIAGALEGFSGRNSFGLVGEFLVESLDTGLDLFADVLLHPAFDETEIDKVRTERIAALKRREDDLSHKAFELFQKEIFRGHPYRFQTIGTEESIGRIDREALARYYETYARPGGAVLAAVGDVDPDEFVATIASKLADWDATDAIALPTRELPAAPQQRREVSIEKNKAQVHIVMGFPGLAVDDPALPALEVLTQALSGQGGRLFLELRDKRSLAYSVTAFSIEGLDPGAFGVYIASAPDKLDESIAGLEHELARLLEEPLSQEEFDRAKGYLAGSQAVSLQRYSTQASLLALDELYGLGAGYHLDYGARIDAVTREQVAAIAQRLIRLDRPLVAVIR